MSMHTLALVLVLQAPAVPPNFGAPERTEAPPEQPVRGAEDPGARPRSWQNLNAVDVIVNGDCITRTEVARMVMSSRERRPVSTPEERQQRRLEVGVAQVRRLLQVQGGKDLGYDQNMIDRFIKDRFNEDLERTGSISLLADQLALEETGSAEYRQMRESRIYEQLWAASSIGRFAGAGGRPYVDRNVRPGRLALEFQRQGEKLDLPAIVVLRELILPPRQGEELDATARRAGALRTRIAAGEDFLEAARAAGAAKLENDGLAVREEAVVLKLVPSLQPFLASAQPGDLSEVLPYAPTGELQGFRIVRLEERREPKEARFEEQELQGALTRMRQRAMDDHRMEVALARLLEAAYVWPPEAFGRAKAQPAADARATPPPEGAQKPEQARAQTPASP